MRKLIILLWGAILVGISYFLISHDINISLSELPAYLKNQIEHLGIWSVVAFIAFGIIRPLLLIPGGVVLMTGALLFGYWGILYSLINEVFSSASAFCLSRYLGHDFIENHTGERFKNFQHKLENHSFKSIILLRFMLFVPDDLISYAAGASNINFVSFIAASFLGTIPKGFLYNLSINSINDVRYLILPAAILFFSILCEKTIKYAYIKHRQKQLQVVAELGEIDL